MIWQRRRPIAHTEQNCTGWDTIGSFWTVCRRLFVMAGLRLGHLPDICPHGRARDSHAPRGRDGRGGRDGRAGEDGRVEAMTRRGMRRHPAIYGLVNESLFRARHGWSASRAESPRLSSRTVLIASFSASTLNRQETKVGAGTYAGIADSNVNLGFFASWRIKNASGHINENGRLGAAVL
jgi:hypothetical protein